MLAVREPHRRQLEAPWQDRVPGDVGLVSFHGKALATLAHSGVAANHHTHPAATNRHESQGALNLRSDSRWLLSSGPILSILTSKFLQPRRRLWGIA